MVQTSKIIMINIEFLSFNEGSPASGYWDQALIEDIFAQPVFQRMTAPGGAVVVIPAPYQGEHIEEINDWLSKYKWVVLVLTSDEEGRFPVEKISHPNIKIWVQYPKQGRHDQYGKLPLGYTTETRKHLLYTTKFLDIFYSAQKTHERRVECSKELRSLPEKGPVYIQDTKGFSQGLLPGKYMAMMCDAKVAPAPAGPVSADSFRVYEALEAGAVPIFDEVSPAGDHDYAHYLFDSVPFATLTKYTDLPGYCNDLLNVWPENNNIVQAWWIKKKRDLMWQFVADIEKLSGEHHRETTTVIIPVSPIKSHPSTKILAQTIESIRYHFPDAEILITFDGVRPEQEHMRAAYTEFTRKALFLCNTAWKAIPIIFKEHTHQVGMARVALEEVKTPVILYVEQDTPLVTDEPIDWDHLTAEIIVCKANVIRFHFEGVIPEPHLQLMLGVPENELQKTIQWSQRPHLASADFYRYMLEKNFSKNAKCFIEDKIHGVVQQDYATMGYRGWDLWKLFIYYPNPNNIKRSINLDGREGEQKYDNTQTF